MKQKPDSRQSRFLHVRLVYMLLGAVIAAFMFIGCHPYNANNYEGRKDYYSTREAYPEGSPKHDTKLYGLSIEGGQNHRNGHLYYDADLSYKIAGISGVLTSVVMLTDRNAYTAIILDGSGTGTMGRGNRLEGSNVGNTRGMYDAEQGTQYMDPNQIWTKSNSYFTVRDHEDLSSKFKQHIAAEIRRAHPEILEVHISANAGFVNQMSVYAQAARQGEDMNRYLPEFNRYVTDIFGTSP